MPSTAGDYYGQSPTHIPAGKCEITAAGLDMKFKAPQLQGTSGAILKPLYVPASPGPKGAAGAVDTNDSCLTIGH